MPFSEKDGIRYFHFDAFPAEVTQAVFTRRGGVSPAPWESLNVGGGIGDELTRIRENRERSFGALGRPADSLFDVWQVHSADFVFASAPRMPEQAYDKADIIFTDSPEVTLFMRFADCVPILLYDGRKGVVGMAHAGWLGTVRGAATSAVRGMVEGYGSKPGDIVAAIGPSIGPDHYEVGADVLKRAEQAFGEDAARLIERRDGKSYFDLWGANKLQLNRSGVEQVELAGICTACHLDDWFSYRAEKPRTGRFGALMALGK